jgi:hypothetical protein
MPELSQKLMTADVIEEMVGESLLMDKELDLDEEVEGR